VNAGSGSRRMTANLNITEERQTMANEINIQAMLTLNRSNVGMCGSGAKDINQTGANGILNVQSIPTGGAQLSLGNVSLTSGGYLFVKNLDSTNYVDLALDGSYTQIFSRVKAGEFSLFPAKPAQNYYARANTAAVYVQVGAAEA
jgi:hypothetical protein